MASNQQPNQSHSSKAMPRADYAHLSLSSDDEFNYIPHHLPPGIPPRTQIRTPNGDTKLVWSWMLPEPADAVSSSPINQSSNEQRGGGEPKVAENKVAKDKDVKETPKKSSKKSIEAEHEARSEADYEGSREDFP